MAVGHAEITTLTLKIQAKFRLALHRNTNISDRMWNLLVQMRQLQSKMRYFYPEIQNFQKKCGTLVIFRLLDAANTNQNAIFLS